MADYIRTHRNWQPAGLGEMMTHLAGAHKPGKPLMGSHGGAVLCGGEQLHYAREADTARAGELQCCVRVRGELIGHL